MKNIELKVKGMMCSGCENRVKNALESMEGVTEVKANHETGLVEITADENIEINILKEKIDDIGYEVE